MVAPPNLAEVKIRAEIEGEVREEYELRDAQERLSQVDRRVTALILSASFACLIGFPLLGLAIGIGVRAFRWAAGL